MDAAARLVAKFRTASAQDLAPALLFGGAYFFFNRLAKLAQRWVQRRKAAPRSKKAEGTKAFYILGGLLAAALGVQGLCYYRYGPLFFVAEDAKKLDWTGADWRAALENRTVAFVGGHHRAGTTMLWRSLAGHPAVASFGERRECGLDFSEGVFAQDVYPRFGVGDTKDANPLTMFGDFLGAGDAAEEAPKTGLGKYALGRVEDVYWTENHWSVSDASQARLLNAFGYLWERRAKPPIAEASVLLEKSPPNAVLARYLQAVVDFPTDRRAPEPAAATTCAAGDKACDKKLKKKKRGRRDAEEFAPAMPAAPPRPAASRTRFVFVSRHPIANAVSHQYVTTGLAIPDLVAHWIAVATYAKTNEAYLAHVVSIRLEDFCASPAAHLLDLWAFLGLEGHDAATAAAAAKSVRPDPNAKHKAEYCGPLVAGDAAAVAQHDFLSSHFGDQIERDHNYTIRDWC